ncbi:MAG: coxG [Phenylobacterium sp.]|jgi:cytochrome c oxidase assembly protein subunit 11|uniref:cytochrome c oxidase assembly protein n=1 Tax=Phenylobacterium sp. TaxID=1871053 RepID=UPI00261715D5|nr:cytochrome c oxidase assembly protein [Phenylobacterium sp.]MDB5437282.1 coxG [Phenylobacterium sp.]MDB5462413.1 coxG [Phenylobacterium sp.]MDB5499542.1 coxG [Phenylobacterium sp.]
MSQTNPSDRQPRGKLGRNGVVALVCGAVFVGMVGAAYASVPLYRAFCQVTGYGGTVRKAETAPDKVLDQTLLIRFDTNVRGLPWDFTAEQTDQTVKIGETKVAVFKVTNHSDKPVTARAVFNVVPEQAGVYFRKLSCFCFSDQTVAAGQTVEMPVLYFVDPKYAQDFETRGGKVVTLSYTFFPAVDAKPQTAAAGKPSKVG